MRLVDNEEGLQKAAYNLLHPSSLPGVTKDNRESKRAVMATVMGEVIVPYLAAITTAGFLKDILGTSIGGLPELASLYALYYPIFRSFAVAGFGIANHITNIKNRKK